MFSEHATKKGSYYYVLTHLVFQPPGPEREKCRPSARRWVLRVGVEAGFGLHDEANGELGLGRLPPDEQGAML